MSLCLDMTPTLKTPLTSALNGIAQAQARGMITEIDHARAGKVRLPAHPVKYSRTPAALSSAPPQFGEHTDEILHSELNLSAEEIVQLRRDGVVGPAEATG